MKTPRLFILSLLFVACLHVSRAQEAALPETAPAVPDTAAAPTGAEPPSPVKAAVPLSPPAPAKDAVVYHLDTGIAWRRPANGDYDWLTLGSVLFGKMLNEHNALDAGFAGGVVRLKRGGPADARAHQPVFVELGIAWRYYPIAPEGTWNPYVTAGASVIWMSWEYRTPVDTKDYGLITRDYLEGIDGYAGVGLRLRGWKHLDFFGELDLGGTGFMPTTASGEHNNLFANFGYVGIKGGLSLKF